MAVFTTVSDEELALFLADYNLGPLEALVPIAEGTENSNYRLDLATGRHVLTLFERRTPEEALPFVVGFMRHLRAAGLPVPAPVTDRVGLALKRLAGKLALIVDFLDGRSVHDPDPVRCRAIGAMLARLHCAAGRFPAVRANPFGLGAWPKMLAACRAAAGRDEPACLEAVGRALPLLERGWPRHLPQGACHTDLFPDNVFFIGEEVSGLIDFYFSCSEIFAYDLGVTLASWCFDAGNRYAPARAAAMIAGYDSVRPLSPGERAALPLLCLGAATRFTLTRAYDRLHPQDNALLREKDPEEFATRLAWFAAMTENSEEIG